MNPGLPPYYPTDFTPNVRMFTDCTHLELQCLSPMIANYPV
jgi:hypothetical protein